MLWYIAAGSAIGGVSRFLLGGAVQRAPHPSGGTLTIQRIGFLERLRINGDGGVQQIFVGGDPRQVLLHDLVRRRPPGLRRVPPER